MRKIATVLLALVLGLSLATAVRAYDPPAPPPGSGINGTVHDLGTAHNQMSYVAIPEDMGSSSSPLIRASRSWRRAATCRRSSRL